MAPLEGAKKNQTLTVGIRDCVKSDVAGAAYIPRATPLHRREGR